MDTDLPEFPQELVTALQVAALTLDRRHIRYALIGGLATGYRSRPRFTRDLDFLVDVPQISLAGLLGDLRSQGFSFDEALTIREWTDHHMAVLWFHGIRIDWLKPILPLYQHILSRAQPETWLGQQFSVASIEGLILTKLIAFRTQDQLDIENLLAASPGPLDMAWLEEEWRTVSDSDDRRWKWFQDARSQFHKGPRDESPKSE